MSKHKMAAVVRTLGLIGTALTVLAQPGIGSAGAIPVNWKAAINEPANEVVRTQPSSITRSVDSKSYSSGTYFTMLPGMLYTLKASGTYQYDSGALADAECTASATAGDWTSKRFVDANGVDTMDLIPAESGVRGLALDWQPLNPMASAPSCSADHTYSATYTSTKHDVLFYVHDTTCCNTGLLTVTVTRDAWEGPRAFEGNPYQCSKHLGEPRVSDGGRAGEIEHAEIKIDSYANNARFEGDDKDAAGNYIYPYWHDTGHNGIYTCNWLMRDTVYDITVSGTYKYDKTFADPYAMADAKCTTGYADSVWLPYRSIVSTTGYGDHNDVYLNWGWVVWVPNSPDSVTGECSTDHIYHLRYKPAYSSNLRIQIYDWAYHEYDNQGQLDITIDRVG